MYRHIEIWDVSLVPTWANWMLNTVTKCKTGWAAKFDVWQVEYEFELTELCIFVCCSLKARFG